LKGNWIVPYKTKNSLAECNQNFLWHSDSVYIMDNHRAALWCWFQHILPDKKYNLFHIDRHYDTLYSRKEEWRKNLPNMFEISIHDYLERNFGPKFDNTCFFRWDNYLAIFLDCYGEKIDNCFFATHREGEPPRFDNCEEIEIWDIPDTIDNMDYQQTGEKQNWIFNVDIDYFFCSKDKNDSELLMLSNEYIESIFRPVAKRIKDGTISVFTLALSPEYSSGRQNSLIICEKICDLLELDFKL